MSIPMPMTFLQQKFGSFPFLIIYVILEWAMILLLFLEGSLAFLSNQYAKLFDLRIPCLLCTRLDHLVVHTNSNFYYNDSMCHLHKKEISSLAYCHMHKKLSDIRLMCQGCLLSFATGKEYSDSHQFQPLHPVKDEIKPNPNPNRCSCCGEPLKSMPSLKYARSLSTVNGPMASPRATPRASRLMSKAETPMPSSWLANKMEAAMATPRASRLANKMTSTPQLSCLSNMSEVDLSPLKLKPLKFTSEEDDVSNVELNQVGGQDAKALIAALEFEDLLSEDVTRTPRFAKANTSKFLGISLDPTQMSPRWANRVSRKVEFGGGEAANEVEGEVLDHKSLTALYMELDEERSAAAVAANNAMAMITRLQAEKAAVQMEALQYQRMMEEQAEYDEEAIEMLRDMLLKRDEDAASLEAELSSFREKYGYMKREGSEVCEVDGDDDYQEMRSQSVSCFSEDKSDTRSLNGAEQNEIEEPSFDFAGERSYLLDLLSDVEKKLTTTDEEAKQENESKSLTREMSMIKERLRVVEADSGFLKHAAMVMHRGDDGMKLLAEIAEHLRNLRQSDA